MPTRRLLDRVARFLETKRRGWLLVIALFAIFYALQARFYPNTILNSDGAYVFLQMRDFLTLRHLDLVQKGYAYAGIAEHLLPAIYGLVMPASWAIVAGILSYYVLGYYLVRHMFTATASPTALEGRRLLVLLVLLLPFPIPFFQTYAALGGHTATVLHFFFGAFLVTHPRFRRDDGGLRWPTYLLLGLSGGFAMYCYQLSQLTLLCSVLVALAIDGRSVFHNRNSRSVLRGALKGAALLGSFFVGYLPQLLSLRFFPLDHDFRAPTKLSFEPSHLLARTDNLANAIGQSFTPFFEHEVRFDLQFGKYNHDNYPIIDVVTPNSPWGVAVGALVVTAFLFLSLSRLRRRGIGDAFNLYLLGTVATFCGAMLVRQMSVDHESRYILSVYFALVLGLVYLMPRASWAWRFAIPMSGLALVSHGAILWANFQHERQQGERSECASMTRGQVFDVFAKIDPPAIAGSYWEVWPVAATLKSDTVYDGYKNRFPHTNAEACRLPIVFVASSLDVRRGRRDLSRIMKECLRRWGRPPQRAFVRGRLGYFDLYLQMMDDAGWRAFLDERGLPHSAGWEELIDELAQSAGKGPCGFARRGFKLR